MNCLITIAYVDPGLGLLAWQALVAVFVGLLFYLRRTREFILTQARRVVRAGRKRQEPIREEQSRCAPR